MDSFFSTSLLYLFAPLWLILIEVGAINILCLLSLMFLGWKLFVLVSDRRKCLLSVLLMAGSFTMMSQTLPEYKADSDSIRYTYNTFSFGTLGGIVNLSIEKDCEGRNQISPRQSENIFAAIGVGFSSSKQLGLKKNLMYGLNVYVGSHQEEISKAFTGTQSLTFYGVNPYIQYDRKKIGIGVGIHGGDVSKITANFDAWSNNFSLVRRYVLYPSFSFRYGNLDKRFTEIKFTSQFPTSFPTQELQWSMGFRLKKGSVFRFGTSSFSGFFIYPTILLGKQFMLEPWVGIGGGIFNCYENESNIMGSICLHYRFNKKSN